MSLISETGWSLGKLPLRRAPIAKLGFIMDSPVEIWRVLISTSHPKPFKSDCWWGGGKNSGIKQNFQMIPLDSRLRTTSIIATWLCYKIPL